jgi:hypothetical protein
VQLNEIYASCFCTHPPLNCGRDYWIVKALKSGTAFLSFVSSTVSVSQPILRSHIGYLKIQGLPTCQMLEPEINSSNLPPATICFMQLVGLLVERSTTSLQSPPQPAAKKRRPAQTVGCCCVQVGFRQQQLIENQLSGFSKGNFFNKRRENLSVVRDLS